VSSEVSWVNWSSVVFKRVWNIVQLFAFIFRQLQVH
jgi:hypothetical protein